MKTLFALAIAVGVVVPVCQTHAHENGVKKVGYEILQIKSFNEIIAWASKDITREQFDAIDPKGRLVGSAVVKDHIVKFDEGRTLKLLISPSGEVFPRITRDANRTREEPTLPEKWRLIKHTLDRPMEFRLTGETTVIRSDHQDSFQGPVEFSLNEPQPQQPSHSPKQGPLSFWLLDQDGDKKVDRDEA